MSKTRFIFVAGGVMSGIGKGITVASTARILKDYGFKVSAVKIDPYLNVDAGTMNPTEHGEVYVTNDGLECDQDIGNYERFLDQDMNRDNYMTSGSVYSGVIGKERELNYKGKCVQVIPHITDDIESRLMQAAKNDKADFMLVEIGGTVGEYENLLFLETGRIMKLKMPGKVLFALVSYFPIPKLIGEMKTKPTQHAVRSMNYSGVQPDFIIARSSRALDMVRKQKVSSFCNVAPEDVISAPDIEIIYEVPQNFEKDNIGKRILIKSGLKFRRKNTRSWDNFVKNIRKSRKLIKIGIVGKYFGTGDFTLSDSYISVIEAVKHAAWDQRLKPEIEWLNSERYEKDPEAVAELSDYDGIIVPGGFGKRGVEGKINVIKYCRENDIPFLGLCYGMQLATVEYARNVCGLKNAHSSEIVPATKDPVIHTMHGQIDKIKSKDMGGSMRLGTYKCALLKKSRAHALYNKDIVNERHRHRYELNNDYRKILEEAGLICSGINPKENLVEMIELSGHRFFFGSQFHPEFKSRPLSPHPLFLGLVRAASV